jgi:hypothetical protein
MPNEHLVKYFCALTLQVLNESYEVGRMTDEYSSRYVGSIISLLVKKNLPVLTVAGRSHAR